jgi:flagellar assembly protein FliH
VVAADAGLQMGELTDFHRDVLAESGMKEPPASPEPEPEPEPESGREDDDDFPPG